MVDVLRDVVPDEEFIPGVGEVVVAELVEGVCKERRDEHAFGLAKANPGGGVGVGCAQAAVLVLAFAAASARIVRPGCAMTA